MAKLSLRPTKIAIIIAWVGLCLFALFTNAIKFDMPLGYAGMYASMAAELANNNFILPHTASFYGPGGFPFAYPPLGLYLMALVTKIGIPALFYLRFAPPVIGFLALLAFFGLSKTIFSSTPAAMLATLLAATSPYLFESHIWAAGIVRGLAFGLFSLAFWAFLKIKPDQSFSKQALLVGILAGLVALTHLAYIFFLCLWIGLWMLLHAKEKMWRSIPAILAGALIISLPWLAILIVRYGLNIFFQAMDAHGTLLWVEVLGNSPQIIQLYLMGLSELLKTPLLAGLAIAGIGWQLVQKRVALPVLFGVSAFFNIESRRFVVLLGILLAVYFFLALHNATSRHKKTQLALSVLILVLTCTIYISGLNQIQQTTPSITASLLEVSRYISTETPQKSQFFFIADYQEAEWFPYLAQRTPIIAPWGGEWLGNLEEQTSLFYQSFACAQAADLACLEDVISRSGKTPDYFIILKKKYRPLLNILEHTNGWSRTYNNPNYQIWQNSVVKSKN